MAPVRSFEQFKSDWSNGPYHLLLLLIGCNKHFSNHMIHQPIAFKLIVEGDFFSSTDWLDHKESDSQLAIYGPLINGK